MLFQKKKKDPRILLIQSSLNDHSLTAVVVSAVAEILNKKTKIPCDILDLRVTNVDFFDGRPLEKYSEETQMAYAKIQEADGYIIGMPVYSYTMAGALKNLIDLSSDVMRGKFAGIICNSDSTRSYLASIDLMKALSSAARVITVQPIVHTYKESFKKEVISDEKVYEVIEEMLQALLKSLDGGRV